jgi:cytochrome c biogenesis protein CcmG, thiol:disulfide interchange protein DsbE
MSRHVEGGSLYYKGVKHTYFRYALFPLLLALVVLSSCRGGRPNQIGQTAPDFTVKDSEKTVTLSQYKGKTVLLNFWATWCPPCVQEMPSMVELQKQLGDQIVIVAVSTDVDEGAYKKFTQTRTQGLVTVNDQAQKSNALYGTYQYPETYVIDKNGVIVRKLIGPQEWTSPEMVEYLKKL